jgi:large subunit ribosomal protein L22
LVINLVRGMDVEHALDQLSVLPKRSSLPVTKLINSAVANAVHNFKLEAKDLVVKSIIANEGPRLKRWQPRAFGRAAEILKRTTHITVILEDKAKSAAPKRGATTKMTTTKTDTNIVSLPAATAKTATPKKTVKTVKKSPTAKSKARDAQDVTVRRSGTE